MGGLAAIGYGIYGLYLHFRQNPQVGLCISSAFNGNPPGNYVFLYNIGSSTSTTISDFSLTFNPPCGGRDCCYGDLCDTANFTETVHGINQHMTIRPNPPFVLEGGNCATFCIEFTSKDFNIVINKFDAHTPDRPIQVIQNNNGHCYKEHQDCSTEKAPLPCLKFPPLADTVKSTEQKSNTSTSSKNLQKTATQNAQQQGLKTSAASAKYANSWFNFLPIPKTLLSSASSIKNLLSTGIQCLNYLAESEIGKRAVEAICISMAYQVAQDSLPGLMSSPTPTLGGPG